MSTPRRERHQPHGEVSASPTLHHSAEPAPAPNVINFTHEDTYWHRRICLFLAEHPGATLFALVHHLWPDFLALPASRRAQTWFWAKDQLHRLRDAGVVQSREEADGVALWSLLRVRGE